MTRLFCVSRGRRCSKRLTACVVSLLGLCIFRIVPWASSPVHSGFGIALLRCVGLGLRGFTCSKGGLRGSGA